MYFHFVVFSRFRADFTKVSETGFLHFQIGLQILPVQYFLVKELFQDPLHLQ